MTGWYSAWLLIQILETLFLVALVPRPRVHLKRFHGVFAPNSQYRARVQQITRQGCLRACGRIQPANAPHPGISQLWEAEVGGNYEKTGRKAQISGDFIVEDFREIVFIRLVLGTRSTWQTEHDGKLERLRYLGVEYPSRMIDLVQKDLELLDARSTESRAVSPE